MSPVCGVISTNNADIQNIVNIMMETLGVWL